MKDYRIGLIQPKDRDYNRRGATRENHIELQKENISHALMTNTIPVIVEIIKEDDNALLLQ